MKKAIKIIGNILFVLSIIALPVSFSLSSLIGETDIFSVAGIVRYSWIMWLFTPVCLLSLLVGKYLKSQNEKYKKNYIAAIISLVLLILFGSYRFMFNNITYDVGKITAIEEKTNLNLPDDVKIATIDLEKYTLNYAKITSENEKLQFDNEVENNKLWKSNLSAEIKGVLPVDVQMESVNFDYFVLYNASNDKYNSVPSYDEFSYIFIAYDCQAQRLVIVEMPMD